MNKPSTMSHLICVNCRKLVPEECDAQVYEVSTWERKVCRGSDGEHFEGGMFRIVMGHGVSYLVPLRPVRAP